MLNGQWSMFNGSTCLKAHIKSLHTMGQCTHRNEVDTLLGIVANGVERDATAGLCLVASGNDVNSLLGIGHAEVVEHNTVHATVVEHLLKLVERTYLNLNLQVEALLLQIGMAAVDGIDATPSGLGVDGRQRDNVEESDTMV